MFNLKKCQAILWWDGVQFKRSCIFGLKVEGLFFFSLPVHLQTVWCFWKLRPLWMLESNLQNPFYLNLLKSDFCLFSIPGLFFMAIYKTPAQHSALEKVQTWGLSQTFFSVTFGREFSRKQKTFKSPWNISAKGVKKIPKVYILFFLPNIDREVIPWVYKMFLLERNIITGTAEIVWAVSTCCRSSLSINTSTRKA